MVLLRVRKSAMQQQPDLMVNVCSISQKLTLLDHYKVLIAKTESLQRKHQILQKLSAVCCSVLIKTIEKKNRKHSTDILVITIVWMLSNLHMEKDDDWAKVILLKTCLSVENAKTRKSVVERRHFNSL